MRGLQIRLSLVVSCVVAVPGPSNTVELITKLCLNSAQSTLTALRTEYTKQRQQKMPSNSLVTPLLTDLYQITMTYAHWKNKRHEEHAVFELFFRKNPFKGTFTLFCGLDEVVSHVQAFKFTQEGVDFR